jgi:polyvinyl alcohol dehydrogenase (cytochrome)
MFTDAAHRFLGESFRRSSLLLAIGVLALALSQPRAAHAQQSAEQAPQADAKPANAPPAGGFRFGTGLGGQMVFVQRCSTCHSDATRPVVGEGRAPTLNTMQQLPPERVYDALVSGKMMAIGAQISEGELRAVAEWLGGRPLGAAGAGDASKMAGRCERNRPVTAAAKGDWNGWAADTSNARYQSAAGFGVDRIPKLRLKWAFGLPNVAESYSQPTVVGGHVYFGGDAGFIYAVQAGTGCVEWSFQAKAGVRNAPTVAPLKRGSSRQAVFFGDLKGYVYAVDAANGQSIWITRVDDQPMVKVTGAPTVHDGRLYVGTTTGEEVTAAAPTYECCRTRGTVSALDTATGKVVWKTYMVADEPKPIGKNSAGTTLWGPAGVGVWSAPTVDAKRRIVYVATGDAYTEPAAPLTDSIVALDMASGKVLWNHQDTPNDVWLAGCMPGRAFGNCPKEVGPDWDFGTSAILLTGGQKGDLLIGAHKGGFVVAVDPANKGKVLWRSNVAPKVPGAGGEIVFGGASDGQQVYYGLQSGGLIALGVNDGQVRWHSKLSSTRANYVGISSAVTVIPGAVFSGAWDGVLRAHDSKTGELLWSFDMAQPFETINGVKAKGGSMGAPGPTVARGMVFVASGYIGVGNGMPGNVVLAFAPE